MNKNPTDHYIHIICNTGYELNSEHFKGSEPEYAEIADVVNQVC